jgi:hypothetical protein
MENQDYNLSCTSKYQNHVICTCCDRETNHQMLIPIYLALNECSVSRDELEENNNCVYTESANILRY